MPTPAEINRRMIDDEQENNAINQIRVLKEKLAQANAVLSFRSNRQMFPTEFISPALPNLTLEPTSTDFTGCYVSGIGRNFTVNSVLRTFNIAGVSSGILQAGFTQDDGTMIAGAGAVTLDADGIIIRADESLTYPDENKLKFLDTSGVLVGELTASSVDYGTDGARVLRLRGYRENTAGYSSELLLQVFTEGTGAIKSYIQLLTTTGGLGTMTLYTEFGTISISSTIDINAANQNIDTKIHGTTDANLIFADASANSVGIGTSTPAAKLDVNGSIKYSGMIKAVAIKSGDYTLTTADEVVTFTATATATLPNDPPVGQTYRLICRAGTLTIDGDGSDTIKGELTQSIIAGEDLIITYTATGVWE